jgi:hypothetical protein
MMRVRRQFAFDFNRAAKRPRGAPGAPCAPWPKAPPANSRAETIRSQLCHHKLEEYLDAYIVAAGIEAAIGNHSFRALGITGYMKNGGDITVLRRIAGHTNWI